MGAQRDEEQNPDFIMAGWQVDHRGNPFRLFNRLTVKAEAWHKQHPEAGVQFDRSVAVPKADQEKVRDQIKKDGLIIRERTAKRSMYVGDPPKEPE